MLVNLTPYQIETIIQELEKIPEQVQDQFSVLNYLKILVRESVTQEFVLDDIPF